MANLNFPLNLTKYREQKNLSKTELAKRVGVSDVTVGHWESGKISPRMGKVELIAEVLGVKPDDLLFDGQPLSHGAIPVKGTARKVPLYGSIAAGIPLEMVQIDDYIEIPESIANRYPNSFLLRVNGDSMNKIVPNGAYALIDPCDEVNNGEIVAVSVDGNEATLKRFFKLQNSIALEPDSHNQEHKTKIYHVDGESIQLNIKGRMVWFMSPLDMKY